MTTPPWWREKVRVYYYYEALLATETYRMILQQLLRVHVDEFFNAHFRVRRHLIVDAAFGKCIVLVEGDSSEIHSQVTDVLRHIRLPLSHANILSKIILSRNVLKDEGLFLIS